VYPECGRAVPPDASFCSACGAIWGEKKVDVEAYKTKSLRSRNFDQERADLAGGKDANVVAFNFQPKVHKFIRCPECWAKVSDDAPFCMYCGAKMPARPAEPPEGEAGAASGAGKTAKGKRRPPPPRKAGEPAAAETPAEPAVPPAPEPTAATPPKPAQGRPAAVKAVPKPKAPAAEPAPEQPPAEAPAAAEAEPPPLPRPAWSELIKPPPGGRARTDLGLAMIKVPGGFYPNPLAPGEKLIVDTFWLSASPITCTQYQKFLDETHYPPPMDWYAGRPLPNKEPHPVILVSLIDALYFCRWAGLRLPTAKEWTVAFSGKEGRRFPWGADPPPADPTAAEERSTTSPVDAPPYPNGPFAHRDLTGNVRQLLFIPDPKGMKLDEALPTGYGGLGGASYLDPIWLGAYGQVYPLREPRLSDFVIGFRCAVDAGSW
jgi:hypothetical protein